MRWFFALIFVALPSMASAVCMPFDKVIGGLEREFGEVPVFTGITKDGAIIITAAPDGGTFSVLMVLPDGQTCGIAAGDGWQTPPERSHPKGTEG